MRKFLSLLLTLALLLSLCPAAFADSSPVLDRPVLPNGLPEDHRPAMPGLVPESLPVLADDELFSAGIGEFDRYGTLKVSVSESGDYLTGITWTATCSNGSGDYQYDFLVVRPTVVDGETINYLIASQKNQSNSFTYAFNESGNYELWVEVSDLQQNIWTQKIFPFTVEGGYAPLSMSVSVSGQYFTEATTWTVNAAGGSGSYTYHIELRIPELSPIDDETPIAFSENASLTYQLLASADYELCVWLTDAETGTLLQRNFDYSISAPSYPTVANQVSSLAAQCQDLGLANDFEIALWMHDWIINHANYDYDYNHYGPDGVLLGGTGVCDSYSKAYNLLLRAMGIDTKRITGVAGGGSHAWNAIKLNGKWYYVDATWDDPNRGGGYENHMYFCIPEEILAMDHTIKSEHPQCVSYEDNYYVHSGDGARWADAFAGDVQTALQAGDLLFSVALPASYYAEIWNNSDRSKPIIALADKVTLLLAGRKAYAFGSQPISLNLFKMLSSDTSANALVVTEGKTLYLPLDLTEIGPQAFEGASDFMSVDIPAKVTKIDSGAFLGCDALWSVTIPPSVVSFGDNCFDKANPHLTLGVAENSEALEYARTNGFKYTVMDYISSAAAAAP